MCGRPHSLAVLLPSSAYVASTGLHVDTFRIACCASGTSGLLCVTFEVLAPAKKAGLRAWVCLYGSSRAMRHLGGAEITALRLTRSDESDGDEQASLRCGPDREIRCFAARNKMLPQVQAVGKREALSRSPLLTLSVLQAPNRRK